MYKVIYIKDKGYEKVLKELDKILKKYSKIAKDHTTFSDKEYEEGAMVDLV